jgi:hypothetical protein
VLDGSAICDAQYINGFPIDRFAAREYPMPTDTRDRPVAFGDEIFHGDIKRHESAPSRAYNLGESGSALDLDPPEALMIVVRGGDDFLDECGVSRTEHGNHSAEDGLAAVRNLGQSLACGERR